MQARNLMHGPPVSVRPDASIRETARQMMARGVGSAVVKDGEELVGIITERDVLRAVAESADLELEPVSKRMTRDVVTAAPNWDAAVAAAEMIRGHFRHLVVVDEGNVVGVLSARDVLPVFTPRHHDDV